MVFLLHGRRVIFIVVALVVVIFWVWQNSTYRLRQKILDIGDADRFVDICRSEAMAMKLSGVELVDGRQNHGPLKALSPQIIAINKGNLFCIQLRGGFAHKGLLVDIGEEEMPTVVHARFKTRKIMNRVYLYSEL